MMILSCVVGVWEKNYYIRDLGGLDFNEYCVGWWDELSWKGRFELWRRNKYNLRDEGRGYIKLNGYLGFLNLRWVSKDYRKV